MVVHNGIITNYKEVRENNYRYKSLVLMLTLTAKFAIFCKIPIFHRKIRSWISLFFSSLKVKMFLQSKGHKFESETDTEVIAKLIKHLHDKYPGDSFRRLVEKCIQQLEGAFACCFKSSYFPGQCVATRRGSPLLVGIKTEAALESDSIPVQYR